jgi:hypothetical protein
MIKTLKAPPRQVKVTSFERTARITQSALLQRSVHLTEAATTQVTLK